MLFPHRPKELELMAQVLRQDGKPRCSALADWQCNAGEAATQRALATPTTKITIGTSTYFI
jgi:hypothetical protein